MPYPLVEVDLHQRYATDWLEPGGVRVNFVSSIDGAVSTSGKSRGLQTPGDNRIFAALRDLADVVLVGAGTARAEGYEVVELSQRRQGRRRESGLSPVLTTAVVSGRLDLDPTSRLFADPTGNRTVVLTGGNADADRRRALESVADVVVCGDDGPEPAAMRAALEERGHRRILCEGGPTLFAALAAAGILDELCLSLTPLLAGPGPGRIVAGAQWDADPVALSLAMLLEENGALFARYRVG